VTARRARYEIAGEEQAAASSAADAAGERRRNFWRAFYGVVLSALGVAMLATGYWFGVGILAIGLWPLSIAVLVAFRPRAYEFHLLDDRFQVFDLFGADARCPLARRRGDAVRRRERMVVRRRRVGLQPAPAEAWPLALEARDQGRRWGCLPATYAMEGDELMNLMWSYWGAAQQEQPRASATLEPF
jgi:hypothetical protein